MSVCVCICISELGLGLGKGIDSAQNKLKQKKNWFIV